MSLGEYIKAVRHQRGLSQWELSRLSGLTRSHLSRLELDDFENPSAETFLSLARALKIHPNDLYQAAGYIDEKARFRRSLERTPEEAWAELEKIALQPVPTLKKISRKTSEADQSGQWKPSRRRSEHIVGILAHGISLRPDVREGDIIFVDREKQPSPGNIVLCYQDEKVQLKRYGRQFKGNGHSADGFHIYGVVIGLNRQLP
ncbi:MAG: LexA family transcriptional regulator [Dehalococcoidales bacterium]|nr:LexA family transcriptional regulator [Dehalococcoidales bacterium]